jgi:hypothetical protein
MTVIFKPDAVKVPVRRHTYSSAHNPTRFSSTKQKGTSRKKIRLMETFLPRPWQGLSRSHPLSTKWLQV